MLHSILAQSAWPIKFVISKNKALHSIIFKLHSILRGNGMDQEKDVINVLKYANELPYLENSSTTIGS